MGRSSQRRGSPFSPALDHGHGSATTKDVDMFAVQIVLNVADGRGIPREQLLRGSPIADRVGSRDVPVTWDTYVEIVDRLRDAVGGDEVMMEVGGDLADATPRVSEFAAMFVSPKSLVRFFATVLDPRFWPCMHITYEDLGDDVVRATHSVPESYRAASSVFAAGVGAWRTTPCRLGLPPAEMVDIEVGPHRGAYVMKLPPPVTLPARVRHLATKAFATFAMDELALAASEIRRVRSSTLDEGSLVARWALTARERDVLMLAVRGATNRRIAKHLGCATKTIEMHMSNLMKKSGTTTRAELVGAFLRHG